MTRDWKDWLLGVGKIGIALALIYLGYVYLERWSRIPVQPNQPQKAAIHPDLYVYLPKSYVSSLESARKLVGKPLWVRGGYRWTYEPGDKTLGPIEKIVPHGVRARGGNVLLEFEKEGESYTVPISAGNHFYVDEVFFLKGKRAPEMERPPSPPGGMSSTPSTSTEPRSSESGQTTLAAGSCSTRTVKAIRSPTKTNAVSSSVWIRGD